MGKMLKLRAQLILMFVVAVLLLPFIGQPMLIPMTLVAMLLQGVQLEINRD